MEAGTAIDQEWTSDRPRLLIHVIQPIDIRRMLYGRLQFISVTRTPARAQRAVTGVASYR